MSLEENTESTPNPMFLQTYTCSCLVNHGSKDIERGGKVLLPASALEQINNLNIQFPLMFKISNGSNDRFTHAGVLEFTAEEGKVSVPQWMLNYLKLKVGDQATLQTVSLPSGTYCSVEALTRNFAYVSDAKTLLENSFRYFSCLTEGDVFVIHDNKCNQIYKVRIAQTKPKSAVNICECDLEVDYSVPAPRKRSNKNNTKDEKNTNSTVFRVFQGTGYRLNGNTTKPSSKSKTFGKTRKTGNRKRKSNEKNDDSLPDKKKKEEDVEMANRVNELVFIRERQKEHLRKNLKEEDKFPGKGHSLMDG